MKPENKPLVQALQRTTACVFRLYFITHGVHFNIEGPTFYQLHKMLEEQYRDMWESYDDFGEKIRQLDAYAPYNFGTTYLISDGEFDDIPPTDAYTAIHTLYTYQSRMVEILTETQEIAGTLDVGVQNFLQDRIEAHSKMRWMLRVTCKNGFGKMGTEISPTIDLEGNNADQAGSTSSDGADQITV
jgi:starvation-inducible DNA-binding protein